VHRPNGRLFARCWSDWEEPDLDADGIGDAGEVAGIAGDDRGLVAYRGRDDDRVRDVTCCRGCAGESGQAGISRRGRSGLRLAT